MSTIDSGSYNRNNNFESINNSNSRDSHDLITDTNKLLATVRIAAKPILSFDELRRVASSMFVAIFESHFNTRIDHVVRDPRTKFDYEKYNNLIEVKT
jgi:hypothetical protein